MASIKTLKRDIKEAYATIISDCIILETTKEASTQEIINEAMHSYDEVIGEISQKVENQKKHFKQIVDQTNERIGKFYKRLEDL